MVVFWCREELDEMSAAASAVAGTSATIHHRTKAATYDLAEPRAVKVRSSEGSAGESVETTIDLVIP
jgi:hypothetical protein